MGYATLIVLDTHVLIWWLADAKKLTAASSLAIDTAQAQLGGLVVSAVSVLEIATAVRRGRLQLSMPVEAWLDDLRQLPELRFEPVTERIAQRAASFGPEMHGDPADRLIVATALSFNLPLVSADLVLHAASPATIVW